ncbi:MAG: ATP-binding protein [Deltaproteobacteria bacterium]
MNSLYVATAWLTTLTASCVGILTYLKGRQAKINIRWVYMSLSIALWSFFLGFMFNSRDPRSGLLYSQILMIGAVIIPITFFHFIVALLEMDNDKRQKRILMAGYVVTAFLLSVIFTPLFIKSASYKPLVNCFYPDAGPLFICYMLLYFVLMGYSCVLMYQASNVLSGQKQNQVKYVMVASVVGFVGGAATFPLWYDIQIPPLGSHFVWLYAITVAVAIFRYRLMDITVAITRTGIFVATYTVVLGLPFAFAIRFKDWLISISGAQWWMFPLGLMGLLATIGPFIYIYIERKAEARLLKEQRRYQQTLKEASLGMTRIRNLQKLLDLIAHIVTKTVKISYAAIYLLDRQTDEYVLQVSRDKGRVSVPKLAADNPMMVWIAYKREPLLYYEVKRRMQESNSELYRDLEENMRALTASVIIPSFLEDKFMGIIVLGDKVSGEIYTPDDLNVFQVLANQAALAIENAQFYDETKQMQEQVAQAEKMATIGTMADGLSHQINNRLYALSLIAGDSIDTIKMTDTTTCTPEIKEMISQISHALGRIQSNVIQGGEVVKGLLKYSRQSEEGLEPLDLNTVLDNTLEMVQYKVKLSEIDIVRDFPKDQPRIKGNMVQLEEVFFNLIDNAYDAIVERRTTLKEPGYRGRITFATRLMADGMLEIAVEDNGIGIKEANNTKVFTPFFTTKTSSRKGTGLGLYVIKRIITENHRGNISFESEHKIGTRFILEMPVEK